MSSTWRPGLAVPPATIRSVLQAQCPALVGPDLRQVAAGWDHTIWRSGAVCFRVPHQQSSLELGARRVAALRALSERLPVPVPVPLFVGQATAAYPGRIVALRWLDGRPPAEAALTPSQRAAVAVPLARILRALHGLPLAEARALGFGPPADPGSMALRTANAAERALQLAPTRWGRLAAAAVEAMGPPPTDLPADHRCPVHGDLHPGQTLFDGAGRLAAILDWDEVCVGDPAFDLQMVFTFLPVSSRAAFWAEYGAREAQVRARHIGLSTSLALLAQGVADGDTALEADAAFSLENALADA